MPARPHEGDEPAGERPGPPDPPGRTEQADGSASGRRPGADHPAEPGAGRPSAPGADRPSAPGPDDAPAPGGDDAPASDGHDTPAPDGHDTPAPEGDHASGPGPDDAADLDPEGVDTRFREIVTELHGAPDPRSWSPDPEVAEAEDHFTPPDPPPVLGGDPLLTMAWAAAVGVPVLLLVAIVVWRDMPGIVLQAAAVAFLAGVGLLVWRMPHDRGGDDGPGAVV